MRYWVLDIKILHVAPLNGETKRSKSRETKSTEVITVKGQRMNRYDTKVSDYGPILRAWSRTERGVLCCNDGKRRLGKI